MEQEREAAEHHHAQVHAEATQRMVVMAVPTVEVSEVC